MGGDEARGRLHLIFHASFNTLAQNVSVARAAHEAGAELVLLAYPANFYARTSQDIYDYTKAFCDQVDIGVILFRCRCGASANSSRRNGN